MTEASASGAKIAIREKAAELGIDGLGFTDAAPLERVRTSLEEAARLGYLPPASAPSPETIHKLVTPTHHLKSARSVISTYEAYYTGQAPGGDRPTGEDPCDNPGDPLTGTVARYTRANHYGDLRLRLDGLAEFLKCAYGARTKVVCCYVALAEKALAERAGLGFYGKHGVIVTPKHGSFVVLGEVLTDLELEPDARLDRTCGACKLCLEACPVGALRTPYLVDRTLCIQAHCGQASVIPPAVRDAWAGRFYGCTTCQDVCPYNSRLTPVAREVKLGRVGAAVRLSEVLLISPADFEARFRDNQIGRRDRNVIRRLAIVAAGNSGSETFLDALAVCAGDADPLLRQHAFWAIAKIARGAARPLLLKALGAETDPAVRDEVKTLLDGTAGVV